MADELPRVLSDIRYAIKQHRSCLAQGNPFINDDPCMERLGDALESAESACLALMADKSVVRKNTDNHEAQEQTAARCSHAHWVDRTKACPECGLSSISDVR